MPAVLRLPFSILLALSLAASSSAEDKFQKKIEPLLSAYCFDCHSGDDPNGKVNFEAFSDAASAKASFELWGKVDDLLRHHKMPPKDEPQPTEAERAAFHEWYQSEFVDDVVARPGPFRPRRLSATEFRNTLRSLFGFDLENSVIEAEQTVTERSLVLKLLPPDPPGDSRFRNDTHSNPLTTATWETYSVLVDAAIEELFSSNRRPQLVAMAGEFEKDEFGEENAAALLSGFIPRAYRRNINKAKLTLRIAKALDENDIVAATKRELKATLLSAPFIYRGLLVHGDAGKQIVDDFELAERLSYFLWADMPDEELLQIAREGLLSNDKTLHAQIDRMLDSPKAKNLATDFATQWLTLDEIDKVSNNPPHAVALKSQPIDFVNYLFAEDRPLLEIIDSKTAFVSPLTRGYYGADSKQMKRYRRPNGIEIEIVPNQKITLEKTPGRGGLLTMPGVLQMNRGPILRGVWMLERILGEHLPDPPADVGQVQANIAGKNLTFRQRFELHREKESCAICHDKIDPLGFAMESYNSKGKLVDASDTSGQLPSGESFDDFEGLRRILTTSQREVVIRNIVKQMLAYALCRKLEIYDRPTVEGIVEAMNRKDKPGTYRELVRAIATSLPFQQTEIVAKDQIEVGSEP